MFILYFLLHIFFVDALTFPLVPPSGQILYCFFYYSILLLLDVMYTAASEGC